jgi:predicted Mrr-cat superfamily restriction endonuclease
MFLRYKTKSSAKFGGNAFFLPVLICFIIGISSVQRPLLGNLIDLEEGESMSYWLHRVSHCSEVSHPLLDKGFLSIGWSDFSDIEFVQKVQIGDTEYFDLRIQSEWGEGALKRSRWSLWKYISEMRKGDLVVVPGYKEFSIYRLIGDRPLTSSELAVELDLFKVKEQGYLIREVAGKTEAVDLGFFWKVEPVHVGISREQYADQALTSRLKIRSTTACLDDLKVSIDRAIECFIEKKPINIHSSILDSTQAQVLAIIRNDLNPDKFEHLVKWYFERVGATSVYISSKNESGKEGDADVVATFEGIKTIIYVQAKHHRQITSSWALVQVSDYVSYKETREECIDDGYARIAWVVSSADHYSQDSYEIARQNRILLIDGMEFSRMLLEAGIATLDGML